MSIAGRGAYRAGGWMFSVPPPVAAVVIHFGFVAPGFSPAERENADLQAGAEPN